MPFDRPTLLALIARIASDLESRLPGADARLRRQVLAVVGRALAGAAHGLHGHLAYLAAQLLPDTADTDYLERHASIWGVPRKQAAQAVGNLVFTGTTGAVIPAGTVLTRSDGAEVSTDAEATLVAGTATVAVTVTLAGTDGNTVAASTLNLVNPIEGVNPTAAVDASGLTGGTDIETDTALRARVIARIRNPPHGGRAEDYEMWALEVAAVTRAWIKPLYLGDGTVGVIFVCDDQEGSIIPDAAKVEEVQAYIDERRPVTADVTVFAPAPVELDLTIAVVPDTAAVKAAVEAELADLLRREAEPGGTILLSHLNEAISTAAGETNHVLTVPAADVTVAAGELSILGTITWS